MAEFVFGRKEQKPKRLCLNCGEDLPAYCEWFCSGICLYAEEEKKKELAKQQKELNSLF